MTDLMFTDNSAMDILYDFAHVTQSYGLKINAEKSKVLAKDGSQVTVHLKGVQIEQLQDFKCLRSLENKAASTMGIHSKIGLAVAAFTSLK